MGRLKTDIDWFSRFLELVTGRAQFLKNKPVFIASVAGTLEGAFVREKLALLSL